MIPHGSYGGNLSIAWCRSVVKVAIPQRRGSEFPTNANRPSGLKARPRQEGFQ